MFFSVIPGFSDASALLKHECAYCLGQLQDPYAIPYLTQVLKDVHQDAMVRHEVIIEIIKKKKKSN